MTDQDTPPQTAQLQWDANGQPLSSAFGDVYFSKENGLAETDYVFLHSNHLPERFSQLARDSRFAIGETGFGSGLNFLAAWRCWQAHAPATARLHFISVEKFPLAKADLLKALALWPELNPFSQQLINAYPDIGIKGMHTLHFGQVTLTLIIDEAQLAFDQLLGSDHPSYRQKYWHGVDAWFLDGFAPAKNPDMWALPLIDTIARLSHKGTTVATFTAAGRVKRNLEACGFIVNKCRGFGRKRDMITAKLGEPPKAVDPSDLEQFTHRSPYPLAWAIEEKPCPYAKPGDTVVVIGAGLAGAHTARALAEKGIRVTVFERADRSASGASGNDQGIVYAKLSPHEEELGEFNLYSLLYAQRLYKPLWSHQTIDYGRDCGVLQLAHSHKLESLYQGIAKRFQASDLLQWVSAAQASTLAGVEVDKPGLFFPNSGWLKPVKVCEYLLDHPNIALRTGSPVQTLTQTSNGWQLIDESSQTLLSSQHVVIANANDVLDFEQTQWLPVRPIRGQVSHITVTAETEKLQTVLCTSGYIAPANAGQHCIGATYTLHNHDAALCSEDHSENLLKLSQQSPRFLSMLEQPTAALDGRVSFRCTTPDYLPIAGPAPIADNFENRFAKLRKNAKALIHEPGSYHPGLYLNLGHGSRGLIYAPLSAAMVASHICGDATPLPRALRNALNPGRFLIRKLIRNR